MAASLGMLSWPFGAKFSFPIPNLDVFSCLSAFSVTQKSIASLAEPFPFLPALAVAVTMAVPEPRSNHTIYINNLNEKIKKDGEALVGPALVLMQGNLGRR